MKNRSRKVMPERCQAGISLHASTSFSQSHCLPIRKVVNGPFTDNVTHFNALTKSCASKSSLRRRSIRFLARLDREPEQSSNPAGMKEQQVNG